MPQFNEDDQQRQTYPGGSGWSNNTRADASAQVSGAPEASPASDAPAESSPAPASLDEQVSQQAPAPTSQPAEERRFNMPPPERWDEIRRQKEEAERRAQHAEEMARLALQRINPQPVQSEPDPYAGMDPQTADWYRRMDQRIEQKAQRIAQQYVGQFQQSMAAQSTQMTALQVQQFRERHNIAPGSPEEAAMVPYVQRGYSLEDARKLAMFDKLDQENRVLRTKPTVPQRLAAGNSEASNGIPAANGLPARQRDWRDKVGEIHDKGGNWRDMAKSVFGG